MVTIHPFRAVSPKDNQTAKYIVALPYDVFSYKEVQKQLEQNPQSILGVTRADANYKEGESYQDKVYKRAKQEFQKRLQEKRLVQDSSPNYYIYTQSWRGKTQTGIVCLSSLKDYEDNLIKKHEKTRPEKEKDRIVHMKTVGAQTGNVFLVHKHHEGLSRLLTEIKQRKKDVFCLDYGEVTHKVWKIDQEQERDLITQIFGKEIPHTYIADGHHRAASAYRIYQEDPTKNRFLTTLFSEKEIDIMPYNRVVKNIYQHTQEHIVKAISEQYEVVPISESAPEGTLAMLLGSSWFLLKKRKFSAENPLLSLQVSYLQEDILKPLFGVNDPRLDHHISFIGGIHGNSRLNELVQEGDFDVAFSVEAVKIEELLSVADRGFVMPPKSTWFEPKLLDGFFTYLF